MRQDKRAIRDSRSQTMKTQTSFNERIARIHAREKAGENHGFVQPGVVDETSKPVPVRRRGRSAGRGIARFLLGVTTTFVLTVTVLVGGMVFLSPNSESITAEALGASDLSDHLAAGQSLIADLLGGNRGQ
ncbi:MAG: hypothetical protein EP307_05190 [Rhodobacteraceae bacterium]|nr:MAG: hypothetical protein EP307_05190 [Paracoccaceae bacterium]